MSTTLKNIKIPYPTEGVIRSAQLNDTVAPENSVQLALNMNFDCVGAITSRGGISLLTTRSGSVKSFGTLNIQNGIKRLFAQVGTDVSVWNGTTWTSVRTLTGSGKARFSQYLNRTWMVNGNASSGGNVPLSSGGSTFDTTNVPGTLPAGDFIQAGFDGRVWIADKSTDIVYYTDIVQFTPPSTYALTFDLSTNFIKTFSPQDGESITGFFRVPRALLLFKENHIYRIYSASNVDPYPAYNVGTFSQESIVQAKDGLYFHHSSGFYKFAYDGQPIEISRRVIDFVKAITRSNYENITGIFDGFDNIEWSVGSVTVEDVTYASCVMRYSISTQVWTIYDYTGNTITSMIRYDNGTTIESLMGTSTGNIGKMNTGTDDFGSEIFVDYIDRWRSFTEMYSKSKNISGITVVSQNAGGLRLMYQHKKNSANVWEYIDTVNSDYDSIMPNANTEDFASVRLRIVGNSKGTPIAIHGIEILSIQDKGFENN